MYMVSGVLFPVPIVIYMGLRISLEKIAKKKGYRVKELCSGRYELRKEFEIMSTSAVVDTHEGVKYNTSPKFLPMIIATILFAATFLPLVILVYLIYAVLSSIRKRSMIWDLKDLEALTGS